MWNLLPQEVAYDKVNRFKEDIETLIYVKGDVHISTHCHPAKHKAPLQCGWVKQTKAYKFTPSIPTWRKALSRNPHHPVMWTPEHTPATPWLMGSFATKAPSAPTSKPSHHQIKGLGWDTRAFPFPTLYSLLTLLLLSTQKSIPFFQPKNKKINNYNSCK